MKIRYYEKRPGSWHLDFSTPETGRVRPYGGPTRAEAERNAARVIADTLRPATATPAVAPAVAPVGGPTILEAFRLASHTRGGWIKSKDKGTLTTTFNALGLPPTTPVASLNRDSVRLLLKAWVAAPGKRAGATLAASTINSRLSMLSALLEACDMLPHGVKHLPVRGNRRTRRVSDSELGSILDWCAENVHREGAAALAKMAQFAVDTCARAGEIRGLEWSDIRDGTATFRDTKNGETRTVPLEPRAAAILESRRGLPAPFADMTKARLRGLWDDMREDMGLAADHQFVFHTLRHEGISRLADSGQNAFVIQSIAGHADIKTTQLYAHASLAAMRAAMQGRDGRQTATDAP